MMETFFRMCGLSMERAGDDSASTPIFSDPDSVWPLGRTFAIVGPNVMINTCHCDRRKWSKWKEGRRRRLGGPSNQRLNGARSLAPRRDAACSAQGGRPPTRFQRLRDGSHRSQCIFFFFSKNRARHRWGPNKGVSSCSQGLEVKICQS